LVFLILISVFVFVSKKKSLLLYMFDVEKKYTKHSTNLLSFFIRHVEKKLSFFLSFVVVLFL
jgi:hypothetical protein